MIREHHRGGVWAQYQRIDRNSSGKLGMGPGKGTPGRRNGGKDMQCHDAWRKQALQVLGMADLRVHE